MSMSKIASALLAGALFAASPAVAQDRTRDVAREVARGIRDAAEAIGTVRDAWDQSINDIRWRGPEREAILICAPRIERYGRMRVDQVRPYGRRSIRVYGVVDGGWGRGYGYRDRYRLRSFTCTVRDDGRVRLKTRRSRRY
jgi:hypothetical protein